LVQTTIPIQGMTCRACEVRVTKALKALPGVEQVKVSAGKGQAKVSSRSQLRADKVEAAIRKAGYTVGATSYPTVTKERQVWQDVAAAVALAALVVVIWQVADLGRVGDAASRAATGGSLIFVLLLGIAASISTCMALVGGIVMALSAAHTARFPNATAAQRLRPQAMFNLGRIIGFSALGAAIGALGNMVSLKGRWLGLAMLAAALVMGFLGVKLTGLFPKLSAHSLTLPPALTRWTQTDTGEYRDTTALLLGAASFFLPCGFTQAMQVYALSTASPAKAALVMGLFAVGTTPGLMGVGALASLAKGPKAGRVFRYVGVAVLGFGLFTGLSAFRLICSHTPTGSPTAAATTTLGPATPTQGTTPTQGATATSATDATPATQDLTALQAKVSSNVTINADGSQTAKVTVGSGYQPEDTVIVAGLPTQLVYYLEGYGCASVVDAGIFGQTDWLYLEPGDNTIDLPGLAPGTYDYSCAMGMYRGRVTVVEA
jgi:sulfite exporter TauE/SafE/copper chaperone CopZ